MIVGGFESKPETFTLSLRDDPGVEARSPDDVDGPGGPVFEVTADSVRLRTVQDEDRIFGVEPEEDIGLRKAPPAETECERGLL